MSRRGKIARQSRKIRDELNQRLDDGEQGARLIEWLNSLPEVQEVLRVDFEGRPITESNLTHWRNGGFLEWLARRDADDGLEGLNENGAELCKVKDVVVDEIEAVLLARYAVLLNRTHGAISDELRALLQCMSKSLRDIIRYRRYEQARKRTQIQQETLDLKRQKTDEGQRKKFLELAKDAKIQDKLTPKMTEEEKAAALEAYLFPKHQ